MKQCVAAIMWLPLFMALVLCPPAQAQTPFKILPKTMTMAKRPANLEMTQLKAEKHNGTWYYYATIHNKNAGRSVNRDVELRAFQTMGSATLSAGVSAMRLNLGGDGSTTSTIIWQRKANTHQLRVELWDMEAKKKIAEQTISLPGESMGVGSQAAPQSSSAAEHANLYDPNATEQVEIVNAEYLGGYRFRVTVKNVGDIAVTANKLEARFSMPRMLGDIVIRKSLYLPAIAPGQEATRQTTPPIDLEMDCGLYHDIHVDVVDKATEEVKASATFAYTLPEVDITDLRIEFVDPQHRLDIKGSFANKSDNQVKLLLKLRVGIAKRAYQILQTLWFEFPVALGPNDEMTTTLKEDLIPLINESIPADYPGVKGYLVYMVGDLVMPATRQCPMEVFIHHFERGMSSELLQYGYYDD